MGDDDDLDCEHDWQLEQVIADEKGARQVHRCQICDAVSYEASRSDRDGFTGT